MNAIKKLEQIGRLINFVVYIEKKSGLPAKFKIPRVKIKWQK
jgi:hypothetical protein